MVSNDRDVKLLKTIPGVGLITATIRAYTDDINRYESAKKYCITCRSLSMGSKLKHEHTAWSYNQMKKHKESGESIIAAARKMSNLVYIILKTGNPFDPLKMESVEKFKDMQTAAFNAAWVV